MSNLVYLSIILNLQNTAGNSLKCSIIFVAAL